MSDCNHGIINCYDNKWRKHIDNGKVKFLKGRGQRERKITYINPARLSLDCTSSAAYTAVLSSKNMFFIKM